MTKPDPLVDRTCVLLDGKCDCPRPVFDHCKYLEEPEHPKECKCEVCRHWGA